MTGRGQEALEGEPVEGFLVDPARQERRHVGLVDGAGRQQRPEIDDRVALDVLHEAHRPDGFRRQGIPRDRRPIDRRQIERAGAQQVRIQVEIVHRPRCHHQSLRPVMVLWISDPSQPAFVSLVLRLSTC